ncbi:MAG TPA: hypothetical protein PK264_14000 [Hyphomicrobiaceae bacterium]|nr:hypothetical protein [Hyphomicrobiaceae bacterium]
MNEATPRRRSTQVKLVLVGTGSLLAVGAGGCGDKGTFHRNVYASLEDCARDYRPDQCERGGAASLATGVVTPGAAVKGPVYRMLAGRPSACTSTDPGAGRSWNGFAGAGRIGVEAVPRGGFGVACRSSRRTSSTHSSSSWRWGS